MLNGRYDRQFPAETNANRLIELPGKVRAEQGERIPHAFISNPSYDLTIREKHLPIIQNAGGRSCPSVPVYSRP